MTDLNEQSFSLTYLDHFNIENEEEGLSEPSGLALSHGKNALWTVSDDTRKIFKMSLDGELKKDDSFGQPSLFSPVSAITGAGGRRADQVVLVSPLPRPGRRPYLC